MSRENDLVILVDCHDRQIGLDDKMTVHREGLLHRAFSVFLFDEDGRFLLQQRARHKYHSGGLWTNTCCSHPGPGEEVGEAASKRLKEEMGIRCELNKAFDFTYREPVGENLVEHELDHVFVGRFNGVPDPNSAEVMAWLWLEAGDLQTQLRDRAGDYTPWFAIAAVRAAEYHSGREWIR